MLNLKRFTVLTTVIVIQTVLVISVAGLILAGSFTGRILPGVSCAGVSLGGMSPEKAEEILRSRFSSLDGVSLVLYGRDRHWNVPMKTVGAVYGYREAVSEAYAVGHSGWIIRRVSDLLGNRSKGTEVPLPIVFNQDALKKELEKIDLEYTQNPRDARLELVDGKVRIVPGMDGEGMDITETMRRILELEAGSGTGVVIASKKLPPGVRDEELEGLTDVLGQCTTRFDSNFPGRIKNIATATGRIDGVLVGPGEVFSFNRYISPVSQSGGYHKAPVIVDNQLTEDYGGGICQVATTLYGAVLLSGLEIVERYHHSKPVKYVPLGLDATVAEKLIDFRFKNNLSRPVYIMSTSGEPDGYVRVTIAGHKENNNIYRVETEVKTISPGIEIKENPRMAPGKSRDVSQGSPGFEVSVFRVSVAESGEESRELISKDYYPPEPKVLEVGL